MDLEYIISFISSNVTFKLLILAVVFDTIFGVLRAIKEHKGNSAIGIDGMIRKCGMIISSIFLYLVDIILNVNFIAFIPDEVLSLVKIDHIGIGSLFGILFVVFEFLSVLKNMYLCGIPIPASIKKWLEKLLTDLTKEIKEGDNNVNSI